MLLQGRLFANTARFTGASHLATTAIAQALARTISSTPASIAPVSKRGVAATDFGGAGAAFLTQGFESDLLQLLIRRNNYQGQLSEIGYDIQATIFQRVPGLCIGQLRRRFIGG